jgi:hypothetical protein
VFCGTNVLILGYFGQFDLFWLFGQFGQKVCKSQIVAKKLTELVGGRWGKSNSQIL